MGGENHIDALSTEKGRLLFTRPCTFVRGVAHAKDLPPFSVPEVAFIGRSNVGKSSLINALTGRKTLARVSNTPGRTQQLNFFDLDGALHIVDMPGYGYAQAPKQLVAQWQGLIKHYLLGRSTLQRVYVLIDSRHGIKPNDDAFMDMLDKAAVSYQVVLTKADKISAAAQQSTLAEVKEKLSKHPASHPRVILTSSEKGGGIEELRAEISQFAS
jgi:GTP-binding protein